MRWISNLALVLVSVSVALLVLEAGLRLILPDRAEGPPLRNHSDPLMPRHAEGTHIHPQRGVSATFDSAGLRRNPFACRQDGDRLDVLLVGDSNIAALFLADDETLGAQLTRLSADSGRCLQVDSYGVSGLGPDQALFALDPLTARKSYDVVIFHFFAANDLGDLIRNNALADGELRNTGYCYSERPVLEDLALYRLARRALRRFSNSNAAYGRPVSSQGNDATCVFADSVRGGTFEAQMLARAELDWQLNREGKRQIYMGDRADFEFACNNAPEATAYVGEALDALVRQVGALAQERGFDVLYLVVPPELDVTDNHPERSQWRCPGYRPDNRTRLYTDRLPPTQTLSLYEAFDGCGACYFTAQELGDDNHWSAHGAARAAELLLAHPLLRQD